MKSPGFFALSAGLIASALLMSTHADAAAGPSTPVKAKLTIVMQYDETENNQQTSPDSRTGEEVLHAEANFHKIVWLQRVPTELITTELPAQQLPPDEQTGGHAQVEYHAVEDSPGQELSMHGIGAFQGAMDHVSGGLAQYDDDDIRDLEWGVSIGFDGALKGTCKTKTRSQEHDAPMAPFHWVTTTRADCPGRSIEAVSAGTADLDFLVLPETLHAKLGDAPGKWYGAKLSGNEKSGFYLEFDGTRESNSREGPSAGDSKSKHKAHLHVVATLTPLSLPACSLDGAMLQHAYDRALAARGLAAPPEYLSSRQSYPTFLKYSSRLAADNSLLPSQQSVWNAIAAGAGLQPGAQHLLLGNVQLVGQNYRVVVRIIDVSTAVVLLTGQGDGSGCEHGLDQAVAQAISGLPLHGYHAR